MPKLSSVRPSVARVVESSSALPLGAVLCGRTGAQAAASLQELARLVRGLGINVVHTVERGVRGGVIGSGRLAELSSKLEELRADGPVLFVIDESVRPGQLRKLEAALGNEVADRTDIILRVFERRARTRVARLEVEMARLTYEVPRVRDLAAVNDRQGGGGRGERGHTGVQLRKQRMRARLVTLGRELTAQRRLHEAELERRSEVPAVALVGYTNAGKSSLMRALTGSPVFIEDQLFATLATTVRALEPAVPPRILITDTVGFIDDLPHELVASFRSTLAEAAAADLLVFVVDAADEAWQAQLRVAQETVQAIGADRPALIVCNKIDRADDQRRAAIAAALPRALQLSAHAPADVQRLREAIQGFVDDRMLDDVLRVPLSEPTLIGEVHGAARVLGQEHDEEGTWLRVRTLPATLSRLRHRLPAPPLQTAAELVAAARRHGLAVTEAGALEQSGLDFVVAPAVDEEGQPWVLRSPRRPAAAAAALVEARVLRLVAPRLPVAVPRWRIHAPDLIAYARLDGEPAVTLSSQGAPGWNVIDPAMARGAGNVVFDNFLDSYAAMLGALQGIEPALLRNAEVPVRTMADVRQREAEAMARVKEVLAPPAALWERWQRWLDDDTLWPGDEDRVLVHGDLHPGHWLLGPDGRLVAVLDWTEAAFGDPGVDLALLAGSFGGGAVAAVIERVRRAGGRVPERLAAHVAERWAAFPVGIADWGVRTGNEAVVAHARGLMAGGAG